MESISSDREMANSLEGNEDKRWGRQESDEERKEDRRKDDHIKVLGTLHDDEDQFVVGDRTLENESDEDDMEWEDQRHGKDTQHL